MPFYRTTYNWRILCTNLTRRYQPKNAHHTPVINAVTSLQPGYPRETDTAPAQSTWRMGCSTGHPRVPTDWVHVINRYISRPARVNRYTHNKTEDYMYNLNLKTLKA